MISLSLESKHYNTILYYILWIFKSLNDFGDILTTYKVKKTAVKLSFLEKVFLSYGV